MKQMAQKTIAVEITNNVENLIAYRKISFDVIWWSAEGFRIPTNAIKEENGLSYVVKIEMATTIKC